LFCHPFHNSMVEFSRRQANKIAHELAQEAPLNTCFNLFIDGPLCIYDLLSNEMLSVLVPKKREKKDRGH